MFLNLTEQLLCNKVQLLLLLLYNSTLLKSGVSCCSEGPHGERDRVARHLWVRFLYHRYAIIGSAGTVYLAYCRPPCWSCLCCSLLKTEVHCLA